MKSRDISFIEKVVCAVLDVPPEKLHVKTKRRDVVVARQIVIAIAEDNGNSMENSADYFRLDRTTGIHARKTVGNLYETDKRFRDDFEYICYIIENESLYLKWLTKKNTK
jgi:chromosomal replication initiation ATPase DnaA